MEENTRTGRVLRTGYMLCWSFFLIIFLDALRIRTVSGEIQLIDISPAFPVLGAFLLLITETVCRTVRSAVSSKDTSPAGMYASLGSVLRRYDLKGLCAALLFGLVMYAAERSLFWLGMVPFFAAGSLFDKNTWLKPVLCTFLLRLALQTSLFALGLAEETVFTFSYGTCHSLGFENPNTPGLLVFLSFTLAWYIYADRKTPWYLSSVLLAAAVYLINGCRSAAVLFLLLPVLHTAVETDRIRDSRILGRLYIWLPPLCALMSFVLGFALIPLDGKTGGNFLCRFVEGIYAWNDFGVSLFGRALPASERVYYFDNAYVNLLYIHGILAFTAVLTVWKEAFRRIAGAKDRKMIVLSVLYCALLTMESCTYELSLIPLMFLFGNSGTEHLSFQERRSPMKLLIDLTSLRFHLSGVERYAMNITQSMLDAHPEDEYILIFADTVHPGFLRYEDRRNVIMLTVPCRNRLWFAQGRLTFELLRRKADAYYFPAFPAPWLFSGKGTVDVIHDLSDFECSEGKGKLKTLYCRIGIRHAARKASSIITVSEFSRDRIRKLLNVPAEKVSVAYGAATVSVSEGTAWEEIRRRYSLPEKYLLTVSTMEPRKNLSLLLRTFRVYRNEDGETGLVLCGRAGWNPEMTLGESRDMERITATGFVEDGDLPEIYRHAAAFVFPSKYEGFGLPPLEAMSQGCPVISSDAASMPEVLGNAAVFFESGNGDSLLEAVRTVLSMDGRDRERLTEKGRLRAAEYSWSRSAEKTHEVLKRAAGETGGSSFDR